MTLGHRSSIHSVERALINGIVFVGETKFPQYEHRLSCQGYADEHTRAAVTQYIRLGFLSDKLACTPPFELLTTRRASILFQTTKPSALIPCHVCNDCCLSVADKPPKSDLVNGKLEGLLRKKSNLQVNVRAEKNIN